MFLNMYLIYLEMNTYLPWLKLQKLKQRLSYKKATKDG